ncbi:hypothetical protein [Aureimonas sp. AU40]|uniref:hypothetical protein n=1 Tax=Aureimonas sp. AU40 TaxID=1637747 RepID=UPI0007837655|nr:hypothetical protein [Aureimonas sp. AU40]
MSDRLFAILDRAVPSIPWSMIAPHEAQAQVNHHQTLDRLDARGGLTPCEAIAVLEDRSWSRMTQPAAQAALVEAVRRHRSAA